MGGSQRNHWSKGDSARVDGITAETLNRHYGGVSTDPAYVKPAQKQIDGNSNLPQCISEWGMFRMLDSLQPTSAGLDGLPAWFLKIGAPIICYHLTYLFILSLSTSTVPCQWKESCIRPIPKIPSPQLPADFRPISSHTNTDKTDGKNHSPIISIPGFPKTSSTPLLLRPVRLSADWFHHCSHHIASPHWHQYAGYQSICCRHFFRLLKGI